MSYERQLLWIVVELHYCGVSRAVDVKFVNVAALKVLPADLRFVMGTAKKCGSNENWRAHRMVVLSGKKMQHGHVATVSFYSDESVICCAVKVTVSAKRGIHPLFC